ncbi:general secretion pathway protein GspK [Akkermansiaceae bacterium]|nr:general secretion pathway protein GspK [Akkermansiaceae bacterium]MDB4500566.1 general secretion pathway protein GspK [Akkermansiaceae bacterium]MDB4507982.1 general secretion pathway protein GspK [Akkermansiaceae bacterium]
MKQISTNSSSLKRGATLIAVFWIIAVLGLAIVASLRVVSYQIDVVDAQSSGIEARQQAEKGIAIAANPTVNPWEQQLLRQQFEDGTGYEAKIESEGKAFNINYILLGQDKALMRVIFDYWGIESEDAAAVSDALVDWVDAGDGEETNGAEIDYYENEGFLNRPFNRPFYDLDEMRLVRGMEIVEAARPDWRKWFTLWSEGPLDINYASPEFIAVAAEEDIEDAISVVQQIDGADGIRDTEDDTPFQNTGEALSLMGVPEDEFQRIGARFTAGNIQSGVTRIESIGFSGDVRRKIVLVIRNRSGNPVILDRREEQVQ